MPNGARLGVRTPRGSIHWMMLLDSFCTFVKDQTFESLDISKIPLVYHNDPCLRARKKLGIFADLSKKQ